jgi:hypothetical protein
MKQCRITCITQTLCSVPCKSAAQHSVRDVRLDDIPVAETELEPPFRVLIHNKDVTYRI